MPQLHCYMHVARRSACVELLVPGRYALGARAAAAAVALLGHRAVLRMPRPISQRGNIMVGEPCCKGSYTGVTIGVCVQQGLQCSSHLLAAGSDCAPLRARQDWSLAEQGPLGPHGRVLCVGAPGGWCTAPGRPARGNPAPSRPAGPGRPGRGLGIRQQLASICLVAILCSDPVN